MSSLVYVLIFLSLHACTARHLSITDNKETAERFHLFGKDVEKEKHQENLIPSQEKIVGKNDETGIHESWSGAKEDMTKGNEIIASSSQEALQKTTKTEEWKKQARRMLGTTSQNAEETVDHSEEDKAVEDIVAMDYAQPHRKPPIHNIEP